MLALTTEANGERAEQLAQALLERRLVACVSIHPFSPTTAEVLQCPMRPIDEDLRSRSEALRWLFRAAQLRHARVKSWPVTASPAYGAWALAELSSDASLPAA